MNRRILAIVVSGAVALPMAALAQDEEVKVPQHSHPGVYEHEHEMEGEDGAMMMVPAHAHQYDMHPAAEHGHDELHGHSATVYGSLRYGVTAADANDDTSWTLGSGHGSRFGIKGTADAGAGLTAGFKLERNLDDGLTQRFHSVSLSGEFGTAEFGRQGSPYHAAVSWDGSNHLGGGTNLADKVQGVSFTSSLGGPFTLSAFAGGEGGDGADHVEARGSLSAGPVNLNVGFMQQADDGERIGGTVGGAMAGIDWEVGYGTATDVTCTAAMAASTAHTPGTADHVTSAAVPAVMCDEDRYGFHVGYTHGTGPGGGVAYMQYGDRDSDVAARDLSYWVFGYAYYVSTAVTVVAEHRSREVGNPGVDDSTSVLVLKVDF